MTPAARVNAAIGVLDAILAGEPAEPALLRWARASRFAGSGDRAAVRDLVFGALRRRDSYAALGGGLTGRGIMIGHLRAAGEPVAAVFSGDTHAPAALTEAEAEFEPPLGLPDDLPDWLRDPWALALGPDAARVAAAMTRRAPVWLRVNTALTDPAGAAASLAAEGIGTEPSDLLPTALRVTSSERTVARSAAYQAGHVELQDLSPQLACVRLPLFPGARVLDYCAGGGGKSLALGARQPEARLTAHDAVPARMIDLPVRAARAGLRITVADRPRGSFDLVVADVPCSGSGTWRRTPDAKWRLTPAQLAELVSVQKRIMDDVAQFVAPGGHLAYMTCSLLDAENGEQVDAFLVRDPRFARVNGRLWTPLTASDGFFLSLLQRQQ